MAISRLQAALTAATSEVTVAAANLNFDFTLVKCEAPKEYHGLGNALSKKRKEQAETGSTHITARRLGALFEGVCKPSPNLIKAYGRRVSEIAALQKEEPDKVKHSFFGPHTGVDGTSIWAAATSSASALHVQLLACMLARFWSAAEAVSVWYELVKERRNNIAHRFEEEGTAPFATLAAAAQADISRSSLAEWDASARSWLRFADKVKRTDQDQLMLIIANVNISINNDMNVFTSVMAAWKSAVESMENLVSGMPQAVNGGPTLLALCAWHLYPDILTFGKDSAVQVRFKDPQIAEGGVLSVGLATPNGGEARGVYWSLSLAHLTHYGRPTKREASLSQSSEGLSFNQFIQAVLGCVLGYWSSRGGNPRAGARLFVEVQSFIERAAHVHPKGSNSQENAESFVRDSSHWWNLLTNAARAWLGCDEKIDEVHKLVRLGMRRSQKFLADPRGHGKLYFGLADCDVLLNSFADPEHGVSLLRTIGATVGREAYGRYPPIIRYIGRNGGVNYASMVPMRAYPREGEHSEGFLVSNDPHYRWLGDDENPTDYPNEICLGQSSHFSDEDRSDIMIRNLWSGSGTNYNIYTITHGSLRTVSLFQSRSEPFSIQVQSAEIEHLIALLQQDALCVDSVISKINHRSSSLDGSMPWISDIATVFKAIPSAKISVRTLDRPMQKTRVYSPTAAMMLSAHGALACIAYLVGEVDIYPESMGQVFAIAYEDSLYMDMRLLCDPWTEPEPYELVHAIGNVGRPGLTLLVPPKLPMVRTLEPSSWKVVANALFNGEAEDYFGRTTLHLSFTDYYRPIYFGDEQGQDSQAYFLESVVSVYDAGEWVGDINILGSLESRRTRRLKIYPCHRSCENPPRNVFDIGLSGGMISLESWNDILDLPPEPSIVRANSNWIARLAAIGILDSIFSRDDESEISVCSPDHCWKCTGYRAGMGGKVVIY